MKNIIDVTSSKGVRLTKERLQDGRLAYFVDGVEVKYWTFIPRMGLIPEVLEIEHVETEK